MMTFAILKFVASFLCLELGLVLLFLYKQKVGRKRDLYLSFIFFCGSTYFFAVGMRNLSTEASLIIFWTKFSIMGIVPFISVYPFFIYEFIGMQIPKWVHYTPFISGILMLLVPTDFFVKGVTDKSYLLDQPIIAISQPLHLVFLFSLAVLLITVAIKAASFWETNLDESMRLVVRSQEFKWGLFFAIGCGLNDIFGALHLYPTYSISALGLSCLCVIITYRMLFMQGWLYRSLKRRYMETITTLARMLDAKDGYTAGHSERVSLYAGIIAEGMRLSQPEIEIIKRAALLHDIGKIAIPDSILRSPYPLSEEEWGIMKSHAPKGKEILSAVEFLSPEMQMAVAHHERYDGKGYPYELKGGNIPLGAQIIALADAFDAMTSNRAYRKALPIDFILKEIGKHTGTQFAPKVVEAFKSQLERIMAAREKALLFQHKDEDIEKDSEEQ